MNVGEAVRFVFEDEAWPNKFLLGTLISIIPIFGGAALTGYAIAVLRNVEAGSHRPLPGWDRAGEYFVDGLMFWVVTLIYSIPFLILACPIALVWILPVAAGDNQEVTTVLTSMAGLLSAGIGCLGLLYALLLWVLLPVLQIRFARTGELGPCLRFGQVFRFLLDHIGPVIIAQLLVWLAGFAVSAVVGIVIAGLSVIPICGWIVAMLLGLATTVWLTLFAAHLYGQITHETGAASGIV